MRKFKLLKDLPNLKAGAIFHNETPNGDDYFVAPVDTEKFNRNDHIRFSLKTLTKNPDWFEEVKEDKKFSISTLFENITFVKDIFEKRTLGELKIYDKNGNEYLLSIICKKAKRDLAENFFKYGGIFEFGEGEELHLRKEIKTVDEKSEETKEEKNISVWWKNIFDELCEMYGFRYDNEVSKYDYLEFPFPSPYGIKWGVRANTIEKKGTDWQYLEVYDMYNETMVIIARCVNDVIRIYRGLCLIYQYMPKI